MAHGNRPGAVPVLMASSWSGVSGLSWHFGCGPQGVTLTLRLCGAAAGPRHLLGPGHDTAKGARHCQSQRGSPSPAGFHTSPWTWSMGPRPNGQTKGTPCRPPHSGERQCWDSSPGRATHLSAHWGSVPAPGAAAPGQSAQAREPWDLRPLASVQAGVCPSPQPRALLRAHALHLVG